MHVVMRHVLHAMRTGICDTAKSGVEPKLIANRRHGGKETNLFIG